MERQRRGSRPWVELESSQAGWDSQSVGRVRRALGSESAQTSEQTRQVPVRARAAHTHTHTDVEQTSAQGHTLRGWAEAATEKNEGWAGERARGEGWSVGSNEPKTEAQREKQN